mmetsp:Transcript_51628/g.136366  ORF Transcript_51628/g.136366 Transcript_51628/m.136366 type:complete len:777 (+) Transcript_51628:91-2421(+)
MVGRGGRAKAEALVQQLRAQLIERHGSLIRAWRRDFDTEGTGRLLFSEFCKIIAELKFSSDVVDLWTALAQRLDNRSRGMLQADVSGITLSHIDPPAGAAFERFCDWLRDTYQTAGSLQQLIAPNADFDLDQFVQACTVNRFEFQSEEEKVLLFEGLDISKPPKGRLTEEDFMAFEPRKKEQQRTRRGGRLARDQLSSQQKRFAARRKILANRQLNLFKACLMKHYGNIVRGWRRLLDVDGSTTITKVELFQACRRIRFEGDARLLWAALDWDNSGSISLTELDPRAAEALADFKLWLAKSTSTAKEAFFKILDEVNQESDRKMTIGDHLSDWQKRPSYDFIGADGYKYDQTDDATAIRGKPCISRTDFLAWMKKHKYKPRRPTVAMPLLLNFIYHALDVHRVGTLRCEDFTFLDRWTVPIWLAAQPDDRALMEFKKALSDRFDSKEDGGPRSTVVAWRSLMDRDDSNSVNWREFRQACRTLKFKDNLAGVWRALDKESRGYVTMKEFDPEAHEALSSFKRWAESSFNSMAECFDTLDADGSGEISIRELKQALSKYKFAGERDDVNLLISCIDLDLDGAQGQRKITRDELTFLEDWSCDAEGQDETEIDCLVGRDTSPTGSTKARLPLPVLPPPQARPEIAVDPRHCSDHAGWNPRHHVVAGRPAWPEVPPERPGSMEKKRKAQQRPAGRPAMELGITRPPTVAGDGTKQWDKRHVVLESRNNQKLHANFRVYFQNHVGDTDKALAASTPGNWKPRWGWRHDRLWSARPQPFTAR